MRLRFHADLEAELAGALNAVARELASPDLAFAHPEATAWAGTVDPFAVATGDGPTVAVPIGCSTPGERAVVARADVVAALTSADLIETDRPVALVGVPLPGPSEAHGWLDPGPGTRSLQEALAVEVPDAPHGPSDHGVTWISGRGARPMVRAAAAWLAGRSVVGLPGTERSPLLVAADCPVCQDAFSVIELTRLLQSTPALSRLLAIRGRRALRRLRTPHEVALGLLEAAEIAVQEAGSSRIAGERP